MSIVKGYFHLLHTDEGFFLEIKKQVHLVNEHFIDYLTSTSYPAVPCNTHS